MEEQGSSRRLSAVLIADIAGYTKLVEQDTEGTVSELKSVRSSVINPAISRLNGRIVKHTGDGFLAEFQVAGFYEQGTVSSNLGAEFWNNFKDSYGVGVRLITGSAVARLDFGFSDEGSETTAYWDYPF